MNSGIQLISWEADKLIDEVKDVACSPRKGKWKRDSAPLTAQLDNMVERDQPLSESSDTIKRNDVPSIGTMQNLFTYTACCCELWKNKKYNVYRNRGEPTATATAASTRRHVPSNHLNIENFNRNFNMARDYLNFAH